VHTPTVPPEFTCSERSQPYRMGKERADRLQAVHDKFRAVVAVGERMPVSWRDAAPQHRQAFENFFAGWKPLPPSMALPPRKVARQAGVTAGDWAAGTPRSGGRRSAAEQRAAAEPPAVRM
jgi:hypothetical protein